MTVALLSATVLGVLSFGSAQAQGRSSSPGGAGKPPASANPSGSKEKKSPENGLTIGNMRFTYSSLDLSNGQDLVMHGPDVHMDATDVKRGLHIVVFADRMVAHRRAKNQNTAEVIGNVRYTLTEKTPAGVRTVEGTAQRAQYTEADQNLRLTGGVNATLTDATRFEGPASLRCATLNRLGEGHYEITGDADSTTLTFTQRTPPPPAKPKPDASNANGKTKPKTPMQVGSVRITGFRAAHLVENEDARFEGPLVTVETANAQTRTQNTFKAPLITAALEKNKQRVDAKGGIQFDNRTVDAKQNTQRLEGKANSAFWDQATARLEADGNISATLTNAQTLKEPATLVAGHLTAELGDEPRYIVTGSPDRTRFAFNPRTKPGVKGKGDRERGKAANAAAQGLPAANANTPPIPADKSNVADKTQDADNQGQAAGDAALNSQPAGSPAGKDTPLNPPFVFGSIVVIGFQSATYAPGKSIAVEGPKVHFTSTNPEAQNFADMSAPHVNATFDADNAIIAMKASGGVKYRFEQPLPEHKEHQWLAGDGSTVVFTNTEQARTVQVEGVTQVDYYNPVNLAEVFHTEVDNKDGVITYNLATNDVHISSPTKSNRSQFAVFVPQQPARATDAKKKPKRK